ncbi:MAG: hypothetical protein R3C62_20565 [Chloroflexota bacterium]
MLLTQTKHETPPVTDFLFQAALLAGLGRQAGEVVRMAVQAANGRFANHPNHLDRSCIDAGSTLLLGLAAPGNRQLRLVQRLADGEDGGQRWLHTQFGTDDRRPTTDDETINSCFRPPSSVLRQSSACSRTRQLTAVYLHNPAAAWNAALCLSQTHAAEDAFRRAHAVFGSRGRIFKCEQPLAGQTEDGGRKTEGDPSSALRRPSSKPTTNHRPPTTEDHPSSVVRRPSSWITWQLDRQTTPTDALTAYGLPQAWTAVSATLAPLFGQPLSPRSRPWSVSVSLAEPDRVRVGTTAWARQPEEPGKHQRLAQTVEQFGGNGRFAEALYKLALTTQPPSLTTRIGRAVEVELWRGEVVGMEMYCCIGD